MKLFNWSFVIVVLNLLLTVTANAKMIISKVTLRNCGLSTISLDSFKQCCFKDAVISNDIDEPNSPSGTLPSNSDAPSTNNDTGDTTENFASDDEWGYDGFVETSYVFSNATNWTYEGRNTDDPDFVDWSNELSVFWYYYDSYGEEVAQEKTGMSFSEAFAKQNELNTNGICELALNPKKHLWKAFGITAKKGKKITTIKVITGEAKCISTNISEMGGTVCVCSVKSVSTGTIQKKWVRGDPMFGFYMGECYNNKAGICEDTCAGRCAQDFANDDKNVRSLLMNWWEP